MSALAKNGWVNESGEPDYRIGISTISASEECWWRPFLERETQQPYFEAMCAKIAELHDGLENDYTILPGKNHVFCAFEQGPPKVVILGQGNLVKHNVCHTYARLIDAKCCVLTAGHPSPLNTRNPFVGCGHFSKANQALAAHGMDPIKW